MDPVHIIQIAVSLHIFGDVNIWNIILFTMLADAIVPVRDLPPFVGTVKGRVCSRDNGVNINRRIWQRLLQIRNDLIQFCDIVIYIAPEANTDIVQTIASYNAGRVQSHQLVCILLNVSYGGAC